MTTYTDSVDRFVFSVHSSVLLRLCSQTSQGEPIGLKVGVLPLGRELLQIVQSLYRHISGHLID